MGAIREEVEIVGVKKSKRVLALFDSGAYRNYIKKELMDGEKVGDIGFHIFEGIHRVILANGYTMEGEKVRFRKMKIREECVNEPEFVIMENLMEDAIIGVFLMQRLGIRLNPLNERIEIGK